MFKKKVWLVVIARYKPPYLFYPFLLRGKGGTVFRWSGHIDDMVEDMGRVLGDLSGFKNLTGLVGP